MKYDKLQTILDTLTWEDVKNGGSSHYKKGKDSIEPIDLYLSLGTFPAFALSSIIKYASRSVNLDEGIKEKDIDKIIHYACLLKSLFR